MARVKAHFRRIRGKRVRVRGHTRKTLKRYGTIKRGKVRFEIGSKQHRYLLWKKLPHSIVEIRNGKKIIKRKFAK